MRPTTLDAAVSRTAASVGASAGETWVIGLSGGADSTALLDAVHRLAPRLGLRIVAAHLDHGLRQGSEADAEACQALCDGLGVPLRRGRADVGRRRREEGGGLEEAARRERLAFLDGIRRAEGARFLVLAHTRDDQAETVLLRLLRGAGSRGLSAMRARSGAVLRPILDLSRQHVLAHLAARGLAWCEDPSNQDLSFLRNRVRHELLPYLESYFNPAIRASLARTAAVLGEESDILDSTRLPVAEPMPDGGVALPLSALRGLPASAGHLCVRRAIAAAGGLRGVGRIHLEGILRLANGAFPSGRRVALPGAREAAVHFDALRIGPASRAALPFALPLPVPGKAPLPDGTTLVAEAADENDGSPLIRLPKGDLEVRSRRPGDRVYAHGRELSLRRFLVERRVPAASRASLPVVACGSQVVWVSGQIVDGLQEGSRMARLRLLGPATRTA